VAFKIEVIAARAAFLFDSRRNPAIVREGPKLVNFKTLRRQRPNVLHVIFPGAAFLPSRSLFGAAYRKATDTAAQVNLRRIDGDADDAEHFEVEDNVAGRGLALDPTFDCLYPAPRLRACLSIAPELSAAELGVDRQAGYPSVVLGRQNSEFSSIGAFTRCLHTRR